MVILNRLLGLFKLFLPGEQERVHRMHKLLMLYRSTPLHLPKAERASLASWTLIEEEGLPSAKALMSWTRRGVQAPFPSKENAKRWLLIRARELCGNLRHSDIQNGICVLSLLLEEERMATGRDYETELDSFTDQLREVATEQEP